MPGEVELDVDVRDSDLGAREAVVDGLLAPRARSPSARGLELEVEPIVEDTPVQCAAEVVAAAEAACEELGLPYRRMTSGAYHDAMIMAAEVPVGMVFVPSAGGVSHHPDEYTAPEQLDAGVRGAGRDARAARRRSEAVAVDVLVEQILGGDVAGGHERLRAVGRHVDEVVLADLVLDAGEVVEPARAVM